MARKSKAAGAPAQAKELDAVAKITPDEMALAADILNMVNMDIGNAMVGKVFALRAGVGLLVIKDLYPRGDWGPVVASAIPNRSPRTIRGYMAEAKSFIEAKGLKPYDVWAGLRDFSPALIGQGEGGRLMIGQGGADGRAREEEVPEAAVQMADYLNELADEREDGRRAAGPQGAAAGGKKLSKAQRREAAAYTLLMAVNKLNAALGNADWVLADTETLDTVSAALTLASGSLREELKKRG